jgi:hypothetical protein
MAPRWPQVNNGPEHINEHATYLKEACNQLQTAGRGRNSQIPWNVIQPYLASTVALIGKVLRQPAISEILQQVQDAAKCTQNIQRDVSIIKNSVGLSTTPINTANFSSGRNAAVSWAQVAAQARGSTPMPPPAPPSTPTKTVTAYKDRVVTVKLKDHGVAQRYRTQSAAWVKQQVETSIHSNTTTRSVKIIAAHQLKSGDVQIFTSTTAEAIQLKQHPEWLGGLGERAELLVQTYGVIVHGISTNSINVKDQEATVQQMLADNYTVIPHAEITYIGWLTKEATLKRASSIVVEFKDPEMANAAIYTGLAWNSHIHQCQLYDRSCRIKQCFRCYDYGHIGTLCSKPQFCGYCAERHESKHCQQKGVEGFTPRCVVCKSDHTAWSNACPARRKELGRVEAAKQTRSTYWHVPVVKERIVRPRPHNTNNVHGLPSALTETTTGPEQATTPDLRGATQNPEETAQDPGEAIEHVQQQDTVVPPSTSDSVLLEAHASPAPTLPEVEIPTEPLQEPIPDIVTLDEDWMIPEIQINSPPQPFLPIDPLIQNEEHISQSALAHESGQPQTIQRSRDGIEDVFAQQNPDAWLETLTNDMVNAWNQEAVDEPISTPVSLATNPQTAQGSIYRGCRCLEHHDIYSDWPTHNIEISVTSCMRTCVYCGKWCTSAPNLRRHLQNVEYKRRNISIRPEKRGRATTGAPSWTAVPQAANSSEEIADGPSASAPEARRTRNRPHIDSTNIVPSSC